MAEFPGFIKKNLFSVEELSDEGGVLHIKILLENEQFVRSSDAWDAFFQGKLFQKQSMFHFRFVF